ncbi:hypothetical protein HHI36_006012 [Cryptolaemus montrouzieri]|uniref:Uncharacterized protein n=1 Tax=Cryptolaemus montrouzieri TaxID=559131 RepID=A0ABD2NWZ3_9CUCU
MTKLSQQPYKIAFCLAYVRPTRKESKTSSKKNSWRKQPRQAPGTTVRRFNVTVVSPSGAVVTEQGQGSGTTSPVPPRHRGQPFASIPEDHPLDDTITSVQGLSLSGSSRCASPAPSWDFSLEDSDSVSYHKILIIDNND